MIMKQQKCNASGEQFPSLTVVNLSIHWYGRALHADACKYICTKSGTCKRTLISVGLKKYDKKMRALFLEHYNVRE